MLACTVHIYMVVYIEGTMRVIELTMLYIIHMLPPSTRPNSRVSFIMSTLDAKASRFPSFMRSD